MIISILLASVVLADEPQACQFDKPISMSELKEAMMTCVLPLGSVITLRVEEVSAAAANPGIGFKPNDSSLTDNGKATLDGIASILSIRKKMGIKVVGYADDDEQGDLLDLSLRRAIVASEYLQSKGIEPSRISVEAAGSESPVDIADTAEAHARNRRVEFVVSAR